MQLNASPLISVSGDPYILGYQHGSQAKDLIRRNVDYYLFLWQTYSKMDRGSVLDQTSEFIPVIKRYDPDILEEMQGLAAGAELRLEEIIALNARYEFVWAEMEKGKIEGCTALATSPEAASTKHTYIAQNWDYKPKIGNQCIILKIEQRNKPDIIMHTEAGVIGQKGFNSEGIGLCINALVSDQDRFEAKTPVFVICRGILNAESLGDAIRAVLSTERAVSINYLIAKADGEIIDIELAPSDVGFMYPEKGVIAHANNFIDLRYNRNVVDKFKAVIPDTLIRSVRAKRLLSVKHGNIDLETFKKILRDHYNKPNSICRHIDKRLHADTQIMTITSIIMDLNDKIMYFTDGPPCENDYRSCSF